MNTAEIVGYCKKPSKKQSLYCSRVGIAAKLLQQQNQFSTQILRDLSNLKDQIKKKRI
jgi:aspartate/tyrosine/aromatic aminotransferase